MGIFRGVFSFGPKLSLVEAVKVSALFLTLLFVLVWRSYDPMTEASSGLWRFTHWMFNYDLEFLKRGLPGELFRLSGMEFSKENIVFISNMALFVVVIVMLAAFFRYVISVDSFGSWLLIIFFASSPATLQHLCFDVGRYDIICLLLMLISVFCIFKLGGLLRVAIVSFLMVSSIFVHEASLFIFFPFILSVWVYHDGFNKSSAFYCAFITVLVLLAALVIYQFGGMSLMVIDDYEALLKVRYGGFISSSSVTVLYDSTLEQNLQLTADYGFTLNRMKQHLVFLVSVVFPMLFLFSRVRSEVDIKISVKDGFLMLAALCPLLLYPVAYDHFRWWSLAIMNLFIAISIVLARRAEFRSALEKSFFKNRRLVLGVVLLSIVIGPLGVTESFSLKLVENKLNLEAYPPLLVPSHPDYKE